MLRVETALGRPERLSILRRAIRRGDDPRAVANERTDLWPMDAAGRQRLYRDLRAVADGVTTTRQAVSADRRDRLHALLPASVPSILESMPGEYASLAALYYDLHAIGAYCGFRRPHGEVLVWRIVAEGE